MSRIVTESLFPSTLPNPKWFTDFATSSDVGPGTNYPVGLTVQQLVRWAFHARNWSLDVGITDLSGTATGGGGASGSASITSLSGTFTGSFTSEVRQTLWRGMSGSISLSDSENEVDSNSNPEGFASVVIDAAIGIGIFAGSPAIYLYNNQYYPFIQITMNIDATATAERVADPEDEEDEGGEAFSTIAGWQARTDFTEGEELVSVTIDDIEIPILLQTEGIINTSSGSGASASVTTPSAVSVTVTPTSFWPGDPDDGGGPIWDETTGAKLRQNYL